MALVDRAVRLGIRHGLRKGLLGGSQLWLAVLVAAVGVRLIQRLGARTPIVVTEDLAPGHALVVRHLAATEE